MIGVTASHNQKYSDILTAFANTYRPSNSKYESTRSQEHSLPPNQRSEKLTYHITSGHVGLGAKDRSARPSSTFVKNVTAFDTNIALIHSLSFITQLTNQALLHLDPDSFKIYSESRELSTHSDATKTILKEDHSIWLGKAILINETTEWHRDIGDKKDGWCAICYFGEYAGSELFLPDLEVRIDVRPGDVVLIRSFALVHFVNHWTGGGRFVVVYYTGGEIFGKDNN